MASPNATSGRPRSTIKAALTAAFGDLALIAAGQGTPSIFKLAEVGRILATVRTA